MHQMRKIRLEEILPQPAEFKLKKNGKTYHLRPYTLADAAWAHQRYGEERVANFFGTSPDPEMIYAFAYRLMDPKEQGDFEPKPCTFRDVDTGKETKGEIGGALLLGHMIEGPYEAKAILDSVKHAIGLSQSVLAQIKKKMEEEFAGAAS